MSHINPSGPRVLLVLGLHASSRSPTSTTIWTLLAFLLLSFPVSAVYTPTSLLYHSPDDDTKRIAYLFLPSDNGAINLYGLNVSAKLDASTIASSWSTLSTSLPFVDGWSTTSSFSPSIAVDGTLYVVAGDCSSTTSDFWTFTLDDKGESGSWKLMDSLYTTGPCFLGSSAAFSTTLKPNISSPAIYSWGGMCPTKNATSASWLTDATYTSNMTKFETVGSGNDYSATVLKSKGPVAEAGFTFTELSPITTAISDTVTQQINLVVLGGHTSAAFVNMSTAAVWSLPEESWGFVYITDPSVSSSELAVRSDGTKQRRSNLPTTVDPRSGHTTVLSEDGSTMVVYGGWVGDVSQAAQPQLVILNVGVGYGGTGGWSWEIPDSQPDGAGIYGHGAALLPGNVMMVYGGYNISTTSDTVSNRASKPGVNPNAQFFNLTSRSWSSTYTNPNYGANNPSGEGGASHDGSTATNGNSNGQNLKRLGLGLGIGLGLAAILLALLFLIFCRRRMWRQREKRDETVRSLAQDHRQFLPSDDDDIIHPMAERDTRFSPWSGNSGGWYTGGGDAYSHGFRSLGYETLRNSGNNSRRSRWASHSAPTLGYPAPPMTKKSVSRVARGHYVPASATGDFMMSAGTSKVNGSGPIHPIYEADEDMEEKGLDKDIGIRSSESSLSGTSTPTNLRPSGPFGTPTLATMSIPPPVAATGSRTQSPEHGGSANINRRHPDVEDWAVDADEAEQLLNRMASKKGRTGSNRRPNVREPTTDEDARTASNLSDRSAATVGSVSSRFRMFGLGSSSNNAEPGTSNKGKAKEFGEEGRTGSSDSSDKSFSTARSSFPTLQAEGSKLLYGSKGGPHTNVKATTAIATGEILDENDYIPSSPSKMKPRSGWLGSLRRVFSSSGVHGNRGGQPSPTGSNETDKSYEGKSLSSSDYEMPRMVGLDPALLRRKQGKQAWKETDDGLEYTTTEGEGSGRNAIRYADDSDWDIEKAAEQRLVQVMFTVPKERLRVVNAEIEKEEEVVLVDPTPIEEANNPLENGRSEESTAALDTVVEVETPKERRSTSSGTRKASGTKKVSKTNSGNPSGSPRKASASSSSRRRGCDSPLDVDIMFSGPDVAVQVEVTQNTPSSVIASSDALEASRSSHDREHGYGHRRQYSDPFFSPEDPPSVSNEVQITRVETNPGAPSLPAINTGTPLSSTLAPSTVNLSHLAPSPLERNPSPAISLPPPTPVRLARDLDRAGFFEGGGVDALAVPDQRHHDDTGSERTDFTVSSAGGARTAEMVWFERVQRMDQRERERGREAEEERVERIRREVERVAGERERMLDLVGGLLGPAVGSVAGSSGPKEATGNVATNRAPRAPGESPRRRTRVLEMVDSIESLKKEAGVGIGVPGSPSRTSRSLKK